MAWPKVAVNIVTFNSARDIAACLDSLRAQTFQDFQVHILDNASSDDTLKLIEPFDIDYLVRSPINTGFCKAHNELARRFPSDNVLFLNPDTVLHPAFIEELVRALDARPDAASATGKLIRRDGATIDSTGIIMTRQQRHLDRGADELDTGQFDEPGDIFGPSGAAALYRLVALDDVAINGQYFDEDFFAFRDDADLAWRCRLLGWNSIYVPAAVAQHRRRVTPERRGKLPKEINYHSVKNRFLLRINNMTGDLYRRHFWQITKRDLAVIGYVLIREWSSMPAFWYVVKNVPRLLRKRRAIQRRRRITTVALEKWFV
ncbi:MAG TPA: glycosyltransferase family 2 protein [Terriglobia bacterium]|nr:glycosyltransferase family 2 protein [Terriglobia bacterium]